MRAARGPASPAPGKVFRYSGWDLVSAATVPLPLAILFWTAWSFDDLGPAALVGALVAMIASQSIAVSTKHNFFHTPFFVSKGLNRLVRFLLAAISTVPPSAYSLGHNAHHRRTIAFDFELRDALGLSSFRGLLRSLGVLIDPLGLKNVVLLIYLLRHPGAGEDGPREPAPDRFGSLQEYNGYLFGEVMRRLRRDRAMLVQVGAEVVIGVAVRIALLIVSYRFFVLAYLPYLFLDHFLAILDDFSFHRGVDGDDRRKNAACCYARVFNVLCFNVGYHQEHHLRPGLHWTRLPAYRREMLPESERRVVPFAQALNALLPPRGARRDPGEGQRP